MPLEKPTRANSSYEKYRFTYRYNGADWSFEIPALSLDEAKERVKVLTFARYESEAPASLTRLADFERRSPNWFPRALRSVG